MWQTALHVHVYLAITPRRILRTPQYLDDSFIRIEAHTHRCKGVSAARFTLICHKGTNDIFPDLELVCCI
jgi:hypothetical protein